MSLCYPTKQKQEVRCDNNRILPVLVYDRAVAFAYGLMGDASGFYSSEASLI